MNDKIRSNVQSPFRQFKGAGAGLPLRLPVSLTPLGDPVDEARRVAAAADAAGLAVRLAGGVGIALRCPSAGHGILKRPYADLDLAGRSRDRRGIVALLNELGYEPDAQFNALHGARRLFFWDGANGRQCDVFLDRFEMCHRIDLLERLQSPGPTLPLADLLLMKLQIVETNAKDLADILTVLVDQPFTDDDSGINLPYLARLAAADWGLWRTTTMVAERADLFARSLAGFDRAVLVHDQVGRLLGALEEVPKSSSWKLRARLGERKRWYELPEEQR